MRTLRIGFGDRKCCGMVDTSREDAEGREVNLAVAKEGNEIDG
jgi:hypothetical protein